MTQIVRGFASQREGATIDAKSRRLLAKALKGALGSDEPWLERVRAECSKLAPRVFISTADLVQRLTADPVVGRHLFTVLGRGNAALADCWTRGSAVERRGRTVRPYIWHAPHPQCPHCHGTGFASPTATAPWTV